LERVQLLTARVRALHNSKTGRIPPDVSPVLAQLLILAAAVALAWWVALAVIGVAVRFAAFFEPADQSPPVGPRVGGLGVVVGLVVAVTAAQLMAGELHSWAGLSPDAIPPLRFGGFLVLIVGAYAIGWMDDRRLMPRAGAVAILVVLAVGVAFMDMGVRQVGLPRLGAVEVPWLLGVGLGAVWLLVAMLAFNLFDSSDGLAGRQASWAALALLFCTVSAVWRFDLALVAAALFGVSAAFIGRNLPGSGPRVLLGNGGSFALGGALGGAILLLVTNDLRFLGERAAYDNIITAGLILALPIYEFLRTMMRRLSRGESVFESGEDTMIQRYRSAVGGDHAATMRFAETFLITFAVLGAVATRFDDPRDPSSERIVLSVLLTASACTIYRLKVRREERKASGED